MTVHGRVHNGIIVFDGDTKLPEGAEVRVEVLDVAGGESSADLPTQTLGQKLLKYAGCAVGLPVDAAQNHDVYLYGGRST